MCDIEYKKCQEHFNKRCIDGRKSNAITYFNDFVKAANVEHEKTTTNKKQEEVATNIKQKRIESIKRVYSILDELILDKEKDKFEIVLSPGELLYRARIIDPEDDGKKTEMGLCKTSDGKLVGYNEDNSREPLLGIGGEGRNNIAGAAYFYVASNQETACMEVKSQLSELLSLATFKVEKELHIIDFATDENKKVQKKYDELYNMNVDDFIVQMMKSFCVPVRGKNPYWATQIIADHIRKAGIDGIRYRSYLCPGGYNYTIFNCHPSCTKFCGSKVVMHRHAKESFWDFNAEECIVSNGIEKYMAYDKKAAGDMKKKLYERFKSKDTKDDILQQLENLKKEVAADGEKTTAKK